MGLGTPLNLLKVSLLPVISLAYLGFCWTVQYRTVLINGYGLIDTSPENLSTVKSGITTINILIITLALWPIKALLTDIKGEEFFRSLRWSDSKKVVNLATANSVSSASLGTWETIIIIIRGQCSAHFTMAFVCGFIAMAVSALVPVALTVREIPLESDVTPMEVSAIKPESVGKCLLHAVWAPERDCAIHEYTNEMYSKLEEAATLVWAEMELNVSYSFSVHYSQFGLADSPQYIIPLPIDLSPTVPTRWLTNAFALRPSCSWQATNLTGNTFHLNDTNDDTMIRVSMLDLDIDLAFFFAGDYGKCLRLYLYTPLMVILPDNRRLDIRYATEYPYAAYNRTTLEPLSGGYSVWMLSQFLYHGSGNHEYLTFNSTGLPMLYIDNTVGIYEVAFLACSPNFSIETVQVQTKGRDLTILPANTPPIWDNPTSQVDQGNLNPTDAQLFFTKLFSLFGETGPTIIRERGGSVSNMLFSLIFGQEQVIWTPTPIPNITSMYARFLQSATKPYMTGLLGTEALPGITFTPSLAFTAHWPYAIASIILLTILNAVNILALFRSGKGEVFSLFTVARVLQNSNVQDEAVGFEEKNPKLEVEELEEAFEAELKDRILEDG
ncbi:hypothetical protein AX16_004135 [Volvariella volvacea WC 439]|nr:hypothetical protein AX16_004135 [Volvariella volvacea WC 439]